jgi:hypothetical protein
MRASGLSRQIVWAMTTMALAVTLLVLGGSFAFYYALAQIQPDAANQDEWALTAPEFVWMVLTAGCDGPCRLAGPAPGASHRRAFELRGGVHSKGGRG